jgi:hypothetical protein
MKIRRQSFHLFNKLFMVPVFRLGLGAYVGNNFTGYIMVIKSIGRKTGKVHYTPVNYAIHKGDIYCLAGWGNLSDWYQNITMTHELEVILPGVTIFGIVDEVSDKETRRIILRNILQNGGFAGFLDGLNPFKTKDEELLEKTSGMILIRIHPNGLGNGAFDPGGLAWIWTPLSILVFILIMFLLLK